MKKFLFSILLLSYFTLNIVHARGITRTLRSIRKETYDNSSEEYDFGNTAGNPITHDNTLQLGQENGLNNNIHVE